MCGITGLFTNSVYFNENILRSMTDSLSHRGPDASGYYYKIMNGYKIGLGHRRLSIIDLDKRSNQPLHIGNFSLVYNGEIYNYKEIRDELTIAGHRFLTQSDSEVVLRSYIQWGALSVKKFIGMFAYAIYDKSANKLFLVRDRVGVKPLYYYNYNGDFGFSSELKAFSKYPSFNKDIDTNALGSYFKIGHITAPMSIFKHTKKLLSAHYLEYDIIYNKLKIIEYWNLQQNQISDNYDENKKELKKILLNAFQYRLVSDVPVGMFLSGGFDSTLVTALLQSNMTEKLNTFTIGFKDKNLDEAPNAKKIAEFLGTKHHEHYVDEKDILSIIDNYVDIYDEPFGDSSALPTVILSKFARKHVKVALSADGGDELFAGYTHYARSIGMYKFVNRIPQNVKKILVKILDRGLYDNSTYLNNLHPVKRRINYFHESLKSNNIIDIEKAILASNSFDDVFGKLFTDNDFNNRENEESILKQMMYYDFKTSLTDKMLVKVDRATMSEGLEGRDPFLDQQIAEFSFSLPDDHLYRKGVKKHIIRDIVYDIVPHKIMEQKKKGFTPPLKKWIFEDLNENISYFLNQKNIDTTNLINPEYFQRIKTMHEKDNRYYANKIWLLLVFQMWFHKWAS